MPINLLPQKARLKWETAQKIRKWKRAANLILGFFLILITFCFGANFYLQKEKADLLTQIEAVKQKIQGQKNTEILLTILSQRAKETAELLKNREDAGSFLWAVSEVFGPAVQIKEAEADSAGIKITFTTASWQEMAAFRENLKEQEIRNLGGKKIIISSLERDKDGGYSAILEVRK